MDGSKRIADVAENITRKSIVHVADYVVDVVESVTNVSNAENFSLFTEKGDIYIYIYISEQQKRAEQQKCDDNRK